MKVRLWLPAAIGAMAAGCAAGPGADRSAPTDPAVLALDYAEFDQTSGGGWRALSDRGDFPGAAALIDAYLDRNRNLETWQRINLRFHAGQLYAFAGAYATALERLRDAMYPVEPPGSPVRWNAYVRATMAFLEGDRQQLEAMRAEIAGGPVADGQAPNLEVVDRLIAHFNEPYAVAYGRQDASRNRP